MVMSISPERDQGLVLAGGGVGDFDCQAFVGEESLIFGDVDSDEGQVGLGAEAAHVAHGELVGLVITAGDERGGDQREGGEGEE